MNTQVRFGRRTLDTTERTLVSALGVLVLMSDGDSSRDVTTMEGNEGGGLLALLSGVA